MFVVRYIVIILLQVVVVVGLRPQAQLVVYQPSKQTNV